VSPADDVAAGDGDRPGDGVRPPARRALAWARAVLVLTGLAGLTWGVAGFVTHPRATVPSNALTWLAGGVILHDAVLVPAVSVLGLALNRLVRAPYRAVAQGALIVSGALALATLPQWRGYGGTPGNSTVDALAYGRNLLLVLAAVWAVAGAIMAWRYRASARSRSGTPAGQSTGPAPASDRSPEDQR
jgi:hypothetical protein